MKEREREKNRGSTIEEHKLKIQYQVHGKRRAILSEFMPKEKKGENINSKLNLIGRNFSTNAYINATPYSRMSVSVPSACILVRYWTNTKAY